jgi:hypothetical protein
MGVIAAFLGTIFSGITGLISVFLARKAAFSIAYIAIYIAIAAVFIAAINAGLSAISTSVPTNSFILSGLSLLPSNTVQCIGIISAAHVAAFAFRFKDVLLGFKVKA